eukprot:2984496-Pleurochrysis_carterae.AAC.1
MSDSNIVSTLPGTGYLPRIRKVHNNTGGAHTSGAHTPLQCTDHTLLASPRARKGGRTCYGGLTPPQ